MLNLHFMAFYFNFTYGAQRCVSASKGGRYQAEQKKNSITFMSGQIKNLVHF